MGRYQELLQLRADLTNEAAAIYALAEAESRGLVEAEQTRDDEIAASLAKINREVAGIERLRENERQSAGAALVEPGRHVPARISQIHDRIEDDPRGGFAHLGEFALAVRGALMPGGAPDDRLRYLGAPASVYQEQGGVAGEGYLVPAEMRAGIWDIAFSDPLVDLFTFEPTTTGVVHLFADESTPWGASGITARWRDEAAAMTAQRQILGTPRELRAHELYAFVNATGELLGDAALLENRLSVLAGRAIGYKVGAAIMNGTGAGQPLGLMVGTKVSVAKETSQVADTVVTENVAKMFARVLRSAGGRLAWLVNPDVWPQFLTMTVGTQPVFMPPNGLVGGPLGTLFGVPIYETEHCDTVGDQGDIVLVNTDGYHAIRRTSAPEFASSIHLYFDYNVQAFRWIFRIGGQPRLSDVITPPNSSATKAHTVVLDARA